VLTSRKSSKGSMWTAWMSKDLLTELRHKKGIISEADTGKVTQKEYIIADQSCRDRVRKAKDTWS